MESFEGLEMWLKSTTLSQLVTLTPWAWPILESVHFLGLSLLIGMIGLFDLRLMGFARSIPPAALHRLIPFGVAGYVLNVLTGVCFFVAEPHQYIHNSAFHTKLAFMTIAGINVLFFYAAMFRKVTALAPEEETPAAAKAVGLVSLLMWIGVMSAGRLITFFRPGF